MGTEDHDEHDHDHEHGDGEDEAELERAEEMLIEVAHALQERFGDRDPTDEEAHEFMREYLLSKGKTPEEVDEILSER